MKQRSLPLIIALFGALMLLMAGCDDDSTGSSTNSGTNNVNSNTNDGTDTNNTNNVNNTNNTNDGTGTNNVNSGTNDGTDTNNTNNTSGPGAPHIFYTDLVAGPNTGGQDGLGTIITIHGRRFGSEQGSCTVTVGGEEVARYMDWSDTRIVVQIGPDNQSGDLVVHCPNGDSRGVPFTVVDGHIYFVSPDGDDGADGSFDHPWQTLPASVKKLQPGDVLYAMDGVSQTEEAGPRAALCISKYYQCEVAEGTEDKPIALVAYPGATVTVGCAEESCPTHGLRLYNAHWTVAGIHAVSSSNQYAAGIVIETGGDDPPSEGQRVVDCDVTGNYYGIILHRVSHTKVFGNHIHDVPHSAIYHGGFGDSIDVEIAYNDVFNVYGEGAFGIKAYGHLDTDYLDDLWIHHNLVVQTNYSGILVGGSDGGTPWIHSVTIENNIVVDTLNQWSAGIRIGNSGADETEMDAVIQHNTVVGGPYSLSIAVVNTATVRNNLFVSPDKRYFGEIGTGSMSIDHNGYDGTQDTPAEETSPVVGTPALADPDNGDYHLTSGSMAIDAGTDSGLNEDFDGIPRPQGSGYDLGAYEYVSQ